MMNGGVRGTRTVAGQSLYTNLNRARFFSPRASRSFSWWRWFGVAEEYSLTGFWRICIVPPFPSSYQLLLLLLFLLPLLLFVVSVAWWQPDLPELKAGGPVIAVLWAILREGLYFYYLIVTRTRARPSHGRGEGGFTTSVHTTLFFFLKKYGNNQGTTSAAPELYCFTNKRTFNRPRKTKLQRKK